MYHGRDSAIFAFLAAAIADRPAQVANFKRQVKKGREWSSGITTQLRPWPPRCPGCFLSGVIVFFALLYHRASCSPDRGTPPRPI